MLVYGSDFVDDMLRIIVSYITTRVYNKEGGRVPCTAVVRVQARLMIFTTCCTFTVYTTWQVRCVTTPIRLPTMTP